MTGIPLSSATTVEYTGPYGNFFPTFVVENISSIIITSTDKTPAAKNTTVNDIIVDTSDFMLLYGDICIGFTDKFDGFSFDVGEAASGGSYEVTYWDGSRWASLINETDGDIANTATGEPFTIEWDTRPSKWSKTTVAYTASGVSTSSDSLYFVKFTPTSDYLTDPKLTQIGIIDYNLSLTVEDELGNDFNNEFLFELNYSEPSSSSLSYIEKIIGDSERKYAVYTGSTIADSLTVSYDLGGDVDGFLETTGTIDLKRSVTSKNLVLTYTHKISATDSSSGTAVTITSATAGTGGTVCEIDSGDAYCPVPTNEDTSATATIKASGYTEASVSLTNRVDEDESQATYNVPMTKIVSSSTDKPDLVVSDLSLDDDALTIKISNTGDGNVDSGNATYYNVYVGGIEKDEGLISALSSGAYTSFNVLDGTFDEETRTYIIKVCVDEPDNIDEESESNNCKTKYLSPENTITPPTDDDLPDLEVTDIYFDDEGDVKAHVANNGAADVDNAETVWIYAYVDGDEIWTESISQSSSNTNFLDEGESSTYDMGDLLADANVNDFTVEVCVDQSDTIDEEDESNNCTTVDEDSIGGSDSSSDSGSDSTYTCGLWNDVPSNKIDVLTAICEYGLMKGYSEYEYGYGSNMLRTEVAQVVNRIAMGSSDYEAAYDDLDMDNAYQDLTDRFTDVPNPYTNHDYEWMIYAMYFSNYENGLMQGDGNSYPTTYRPLDAINIVETFKLLFESAKKGEILNEDVITSIAYTGDPWWEELMNLMNNESVIYNMDTNLESFWVGHDLMITYSNFGSEIQREDVAIFLHNMIESEMVDGEKLMDKIN
jgi:hypothetical protein